MSSMTEELTITETPTGDIAITETTTTGDLTVSETTTISDSGDVTTTVEATIDTPFGGFTVSETIPDNTVVVETTNDTVIETESGTVVETESETVVSVDPIDTLE